MPNSEHDIDAAIAAEEDALLRSLAEEPPYIDQLLSLFSGRTGWVSIVMVGAQLILFAFGAWASFRFFAANDALVAIKFGLSAATLLIMSLMVKLAMWPVLHFNRMINQLHKLELTVVRLRQQALR